MRESKDWNIRSGGSRADPPSGALAFADKEPVPKGEDLSRERGPGPKHEGISLTRSARSISDFDANEMDGKGHRPSLWNSRGALRTG